MRMIILLQTQVGWTKNHLETDATDATSTIRLKQKVN